MFLLQTLSLTSTYAFSQRIWVIWGFKNIYRFRIKGQRKRVVNEHLRVVPRVNRVKIEMACSACCHYWPHSLRNGLDGIYRKASRAGLFSRTRN